MINSDVHNQNLWKRQAAGLCRRPFPNNPIYSDIASRQILKKLGLNLALCEKYQAVVENYYKS